MTEILVFFLGVSLFVYVILGGADFGAGIIEKLTGGNKGVRTISKAIAPIWEANHIWIILAVVILFNGFPLVYTNISTYLHIPVLLALIGIIIRGTSFTFRYYDIPEKRIHEVYTKFFRISSILTPLFFGIILGSIILGKIPPNPAGSFYDVYIAPWFHIFPFATGVFVTILFAWLASVYLLGEVKANGKDYSKYDYSFISNLFLILLILSGVLVFITAELSQLHLLRQFLQSYVSIGCLILATILAPFMWRNVKQKKVVSSRVLAGITTLCILLGWFGIQLPVLVYISDGNHLTVWNSIAPASTIKYLVYALIVGIFIIFPAIGYLYKVFKFNQT